MVKNGYKLTELGEIPEEWGVVRLGEIAEVRRNKTIKDISEIAFIPMELISDTETYVSYKMLPISEVTSSTYCEEDDILLAKITPSVENSKQGIVPKVPMGFAKATTEVFPIDCKEGISNFFLFYILKFLKFRNILINEMTGSTGRQRVPNDTLTTLLIPLPPLPEQRKIAEILSTMDESIQKTDEVIEKAQELKKGLMQQLLTKGIGHTRFKQTEIGEIPEEWSVVKLGEVIIEAKTGFACGKRDKDGIIQLRMDSIETDGIINANAYVKVPVPGNIDEYLLKPQDILFNNTNSVDLIGKTALFKGEIPNCTYSNHLTRIRVDHQRVIPKWLLYVLISKWRLNIFRALCHRHVGQAGINNKNILNLKISYPSVVEQQKIAEILSGVDEKIDVERKRKEKLVRLKKGLMQDLLTGKVRVKV